MNLLNGLILLASIFSFNVLSFKENVDIIEEETNAVAYFKNDIDTYNLTPYTPPTNDNGLGDIYGVNDYKHVATRLFPQEHYSEKKYYAIACDSLIGMYDEPHYDYYFFTLTTDSYIQLKITVDGTYYYKLDIYKADYNSYDSEIEQNNILDVNIRNSSTLIKEDFESGVYLIRIYSLNFSESNVENQMYTLELVKNEYQLDDNLNQDAYDLIYDKGLTGAIWYNDFAPFNNNPLEYHDEKVINQIKSSYYTTPSFLLADIADITNGENIHYASIYLWDPYLRADIYKYLKEIYEFIKPNAELLKESKRSIDIKLEKFEDVLNITSEIIGLVTHVKTIPIISSIFEDMVIDFIVATVRDQVDLNYDSFNNYLNSISQILNAISPFEGNSETENNYIHGSTNILQIPNKIVQFDFFYSVSYKSGKYIFSYDSSYEKLSNSLVSFNKIISSRKEDVNSFPIRGKLYGFTSEKFTLDKTNLNETKNICNKSIYAHPLSLNDNFNFNLSNYEYNWFEFTPQKSGYYYMKLKHNYVDLYISEIKIYYSLDNGYDENAYDYIVDMEPYIEEYINNTGKIEHNATFYYPIKLQAGKSIYIRVEAQNGGKIEAGSIEIFDHFDDRYSHNHIYENDYCVHCGQGPHSHTWGNPTLIDINVHKYTCECGATKEENHTSNGHVCSVCNGHINNAHTYTYDYTRYDDYKHYSYCECGEHILEHHVVKAGTPVLNRTCMICGGKCKIGLAEPFSNNTYRTKNGSYITTSGIIVLVEEDIESYFNNTLVFYTESNESI